MSLVREVQQVFKMEELRFLCKNPPTSLGKEAQQIIRELEEANKL